jgi:FkbM family methyltransferase
MAEAVQMKGLWIPEREARRYSRVGEFEGILDLDVHKTSVATHHCFSKNIAVDIGAHIGATAVYLSKHFRRVEAFEAIPGTFYFLKKNTGSLPNVVAHDLALADEEGELYFEHLDKHTQLSHAMPAGITRYYERENSRVIGPVPAKPLDAFSFEAVSFIKIDVEGTELDVIRGAERTILASKPIILMEQNQNEARYHGRKEDEGTDFLLGLGMKRVEGFPFRDDRLFSF